MASLQQYAPDRDSVKNFNLQADYDEFIDLLKEA